jgi:hypothetical protein
MHEIGKWRGNFGENLPCMLLILACMVINFVKLENLKSHLKII